MNIKLNGLYRKVLLTLLNTLVISFCSVGYTVSNKAYADATSIAGLKVYAGGNDIALLWDKVPTQGGALTVSYAIYRNGAFLTLVFPQNNVSVSNANATGSVSRERYYDSKDLVRGAAYSYQVKTFSIDTASQSTSMSLSEIVAVTHPFESLAPVITLDYDIAPDLEQYMLRVKSAVETWYPKIAYLIAYSDYTPIDNFTIRVVPGTCGAYAINDIYIGEVIEVCVEHGRFVGDDDDTELFVHEATHILQKYVDKAPTSIAEGIATWAGELAGGRTRNLPLRDGLSYLNGYEFSGYFYNWIEYNYPGSDIIKFLNVKSHFEQFNYDWFVQRTQFSVDELWEEMTGVALSPPSALINMSQRCAQVLKDSSVEIYFGYVSLCEAGNSQTFAYEENPGRLHVQHDCLAIDVNNRIRTKDCASDDTKGWVFESRNLGLLYPTGQWRHQGSNTCMQIAQWPTASTSQPDLIVASCNAQDNRQTWRALTPSL